MKPFVDEGVVHKDRKRVVKKAGFLYAAQQKDVKLNERICEYRVKIQDFIAEKDTRSLELVVNELTSGLAENPENLYMAQKLRLDIIHA
jgi:hypothetical protein